MDTNELINTIKAALPTGYSGPVGIRGLYKDETIGPLENSHVWDDGNRLDEELDGTCTMGAGYFSLYGNDINTWGIEHVILPALNNTRWAVYGDGRWGIVIGLSERGGEDLGEMIIRDAELIAIINI